MLRVIAKIISYVFHPIFTLFYIFLALKVISPVHFLFGHNREFLAVHFLVFGMSVFFPLISVLAMRLSGLVPNFHLENSQERIGPMIATIIFYVWLFLNYRQFDKGPEIFEANILGATIALGVAFVINNFSKISLHATGVGGLVGAAIIFRFVIDRWSYDIQLGGNTLALSPNTFLCGVIVLAGVVGTARLYLKAHRPQDIYGGYMVGFMAQVLAYRLIDLL